MKKLICFFFGLGICLLSTTIHAMPFTILSEVHDVFVQVSVECIEPPCSITDYFDYYHSFSTNPIDYAISGGMRPWSHALAYLEATKVTALTSNDDNRRQSAEANAESIVIFSPNFSGYIDPITFDWDGSGTVGSGYLAITDLHTNEIIFDTLEDPEHAQYTDPYIFDYNWDQCRTYELLIQLNTSATSGENNSLIIRTNMFEAKTVPEPSIMLLLASAIIGFAGFIECFKKR